MAVLAERGYPRAQKRRRRITQGGGLTEEACRGASHPPRHTRILLKLRALSPVENLAVPGAAAARAYRPGFLMILRISSAHTRQNGQLTLRMQQRA